MDLHVITERKQRRNEENVAFHETKIDALFQVRIGVNLHLHYSSLFTLALFSVLEQTRCASRVFTFSVCRVI